jgi:glycosyltransferase involved in cell wall biosynthesis
VSPEYKAVLDAIVLSKKALDRIVWTGMLMGPEKIGAFRASEALILPSHQENFGIAVAESLACGKPVLISNRINIWREIDAAGAGFVQPDDLNGTIELMRKWCSLGAADRQAMGEKASACYEANFTPEKAAADLDQVIRLAAAPSR